MNIIKTAVKRPVTTTMLLLIVVVYGILALFNIKMDMLPNMNVPVALVMTSYEGAGSEEVETLITNPLESALGTVSGVTDITSTSTYGTSMVILQFEDVDIDFATLDMREKIDLVKNYLPEDASDPMVMKIDIASMNNITLGVKSDTKSLTELQTVVDDKVINRLKRQEGVAGVSASGGREKEIVISLDEEKLRGYGVAESTIMQAIMAENTVAPVGSVKQGDKNLSISVDGQFTDIRDIENVIIPTSQGVARIRDFGVVEERYKEQQGKSFMDGEPAIMLTVQKQSTANSVEVSDALTKEIEKINKEMPDVQLSMLIDPADYIKISLNNVASSAILGAVLATIILFIFLNDIRATIIVGIAMPVSIIATFFLMDATGITLNMMSLGGLTLGVGMLVDNSIVVIESIYRQIEAGKSKSKAAIDGAKLVALPVITSTLTTIAVFLPITLAGGLSAEIFNELTFTIAFSLGSSLVISLTFVPMMSSMILETRDEKLMRGKKDSKFAVWFNKSYKKFENNYRKLLIKSLQNRKKVYAFVLAFIILTIAVLPVIGFTLFPEMDEGIISVTVTTPKGTTVEKTEEKTQEVIEKINKIPEIETMTYSSNASMDGITSGSSNTASVMLYLKDLKQRDRSAAEVAKDVEKGIKDITGAEVKAAASSTSMGSFGGAGSTVEIYGDDLDKLANIANDFQKMGEQIQGAGDVTTSIKTSNPQASLIIDREKATLMGVQAPTVSSIVKAAVSGQVVSTYKTEGSELDIRIEQNQENMDYLNDISSILIPTAYGTSVPLSEIAIVDVNDIPAEINHTNGQRYVTVTYEVGDLTLGDVNSAIEKYAADYIMPEGYSWKFSGTAEQMQEMFTSLGKALIAALLVVYMIMAAQFESYIYPFIVMFSIPVALTAGIFGLFVFNQAFSITSFMGLIMLSGIVINNAIVLIDYTNHLIRDENKSIFAALTKAGPVRLRPILMSALTTVLGLVPIIVSNSAGSEMLKGLAVVVVFGLSASTLVTLVLIPTVYITINKIKQNRQIKRFNKKAKKLNVSYEEYCDVRGFDPKAVAIGLPTKEESLQQLLDEGIIDPIEELEELEDTTHKLEDKTPLYLEVDNDTFNDTDSYANDDSDNEAIRKIISSTSGTDLGRAKYLDPNYEGDDELEEVEEVEASHTIEEEVSDDVENVVRLEELKSLDDLDELDETDKE